MVSHRDTIDFLNRRRLRQAERIQFRLTEASEACKRIIEMIVQDHAPKRIWQWGSLVYTSRFTEVSDIDIGIEGLTDPHAIFEIYDKAEELTSLPLDIIELEKIEPEFAELIRRRGVTVYGDP